MAELVPGAYVCQGIPKGASHKSLTETIIIKWVAQHMEGTPVLPKRCIRDSKHLDKVFHRESLTSLAQ